MTSARPQLLVDGRVLLNPQGGGVYEYVSRVLPLLRMDARFETRAWANAWSGPTPDGIDVRTRWPNKLLHASVALSGRPPLDRLAGARPSAFWAPHLHFIARSPSVPLALTIHDLSFEREPSFFSPRRRLWHAAIRPRALCRQAGVLLAVSGHTKRDLIELYGIPEERIAVAHEGCGQEFFEPIAAEDLGGLRRSLALPERFILHLGALEPRKNHEGLLAAYERLKSRPHLADVGLVLAGPKGWHNRGILKALRSSRHARDIRLLGFVDAETRRRLYRLASVFAFPSFYEGFGLPPLEAMASGTPVVASFSGALGEVIDDAGILVDPYRPADLAEALASVLESPSLAARLSADGKKRAQSFAWNDCARKTADALLRVMR